MVNRCRNDRKTSLTEDLEMHYRNQRVSLRVGNTLLYSPEVVEAGVFPRQRMNCCET